MFKRRIAIFTLALALSANALLFCSCGGRTKEDATHSTDSPRQETTDDKSGMDSERETSKGLVDDITDGVDKITDGITDNGDNHNGEMPNAPRGRRMVNPLGR